MRINVYSQEITPEVIEIKKVSNTGIEYKAVQFVLHSSLMLHHPPEDDDSSAVTFWLPKSAAGLDELLHALNKALRIVAEERRNVMTPTERFNATYDANARRRGQYSQADTEVKP